jgi:hypothetical protein
MTFRVTSMTDEAMQREDIIHQPLLCHVRPMLASPAAHPDHHPYLSSSDHEVLQYILYSQQE